MLTHSYRKKGNMFTAHSFLLCTVWALRETLSPASDDHGGADLEYDGYTAFLVLNNGMSTMYNQEVKQAAWKKSFDVTMCKNDQHIT